MGQVLLAFVAAVKGGAQRQVQACRRQLQSSWGGGGGDEAGYLGAANRRPRSPRAHSGALRFYFTAATVDKKARTRRLTLPRVGGRGGPNAMCRQKSTGPRPAELGKLKFNWIRRKAVVVVV